MLTRMQPERRKQAPPCPTLVLGLGNILLRDEGVGVRVVEALQCTALPPGVELFDGATAGLDLVDVLADRRKVIVIDAVDGGGEPGTVMRFRAEDLMPREGGAVSLHDLGLLEALAVARQLGIAPREIVIFGVRPHVVDSGLDLSPEVARLVPRIAELVLAELSDNPHAGSSEEAPRREDRP